MSNFTKSSDSKTQQQNQQQSNPVGDNTQKAQQEKNKEQQLNAENRQTKDAPKEHTEVEVKK